MAARPRGHAAVAVAPAGRAPRRADPGHIFYGSDWPFTPVPVVMRLAREMDSMALFDEATRRRVLHDDALALFPRPRG